LSRNRYYWLKLKEGFFEDDTIQWLEEQENGKDYVYFYMKLCLKSLKSDGFLIRYVGERLIPYDVKALSKLTGTDFDTVAVALKLFEEIGLIEKRNTGEIYLSQIKEMTGTETEVAQRVRKHRARQQLLHCNTSVTKCNTELELEKEKEIELDIELDIEKEKEEKAPPLNYQKIIDSFNAICVSLPKVLKVSDPRKRAIRTRLKTYKEEDLTKAFKLAEESDFLKGNNNKKWTATFDWLLNENNMIKVLEGNYKNSKQTTKPKQTTNKFKQFPQREYTEQQMSEIERKLINKGLEDI